MGMGYKYAGSASYPRFEDELGKVAEILGAEATPALDILKNIAEQKPFGYWFGCLMGAQPGDMVFAVPTDMPEAVSKWLNHPYEPRTPAETQDIWETVSKHGTIKEISAQIWSELESLAEFREGWGIS